MTDRRQRVAPRQPAGGRGPSERERVLARRRVAAFSKEAAEAEIPTDVIGRLLLQEAIEIWSR